VQREAQARGVARRAEDPRGILDERQRVQDAQRAARDVGGAAERVEELERAGGELDGHRVQREGAPPPILPDRRRQPPPERASRPAVASSARLSASSTRASRACIEIAAGRGGLRTTPTGARRFSTTTAGAPAASARRTAISPAPAASAGSGRASRRSGRSPTPRPPA